MVQIKLARQESSLSVNGLGLEKVPTKQNGSVLLVVVVLLLLASLFVLFALNVGRFEQKTSGNDLRAKLAQQLAEAGMNQGVEFFNANRAIVADTSPAIWQLCDAGDLDFPCGAVPELGDLPDPDGPGPLPDPPAVPRRDTMYRFIGGIGTGGRLVAIPNPIAATGGFNAAQQVGAVLCRVAVPASATAPTECATDPDEASSTWVLTVVSKGMLTGEGSSATVTQTIGAYNIFAPNLGLPPILASGNVGVGGGLQIVAAPNAAGTGVPVSVWTRLEMSKNGTPNTCYLEEFLRQGGSSAGPVYYQDIMVCHTCSCPGDGSLSFPKSGGQACQGMDIVDIDNNEPNDPPCIAPNLDIRRREFPADLFAFLFGVNGWADLDQGVGGDTYANKEFNFAEARIVDSCTYPHPATGALVTSAGIPADTCYLLNIRNKIHIGDGINDAAECAALGPGSSGLIWVHSQAWENAPGYDCSTIVKNVDQIGTPNDPVALVYDGSLQAHFQLYGLLFVREPNGSLTMDENTGGSAVFQMNAGATIYGAVVLQGGVAANGTAAIVYNADVLQNLFGNPDFFEPSSIAGSWTDKMRY